MQKHPVLFRLTAATAVVALITGQSAPAFAQQAENTAGVGDPPGRVGRVAAIIGEVSFHTADQDHWEPATVNYPVTSGNAFWTQPQASVDLGVGGTRATLDQSTEIDIETLDDQRFIATEPQGEIYLRVTDLAQGEIDTIRTPRGEIRIMAPGRYSIAAGDTATPTVVTVDSGAVQITGPGVTLDVGAHQTATITGADSFTGAIGAEAPDAFFTAQLARDRPVQVASRIAPPPIVTQMTGYDAVASTGDWSSTPEYGQVWYPPVDRDWVPYRHGHWGFVAPWGWTWIDEAPWGFAPFHYGRWVEIQNRWAWTPVGPDRDAGFGRERPVYAPALVGFVGLAAGVAIGVGIGAAVGWIPLGPREAYRPTYPVSNTYLRNVNVTNVTNVTNITTINNNQRFVNQKVATFVPQTAMQQSQSVAGFARPVPAAQLAAIRPLNQAPVQPTLATRGVTPVVAQSLHLAPTAAPVPQRVAPGPAVTGRPFNAAPALAPTGGRPIVAQGVSPAPPVARPGGLPALAPVGASRAQPPAAPGAAPGPPIAPRTPGQPAPPLRPVEPGLTRPTPPTAPVQPAAPVGASQPPLLRAAPQQAAPQQAVPQQAVPQQAVPQQAAPQQPAIARPALQPPAPPVQPATPAVPSPTQPAAVPTTPRVATPPAAPVQRAAPPPAPLVEHAAPPPQPAPPVQHAAPPPPPPAPVQHAAPPPPPEPSVQHAAPPPPVQHAEPPVQHAAPPPPPAPRPAPPAHKACPPNEKSC